MRVEAAMSAIEYIIENMRWALEAAKAANDYVEVHAIASELEVIARYRGI